MDQDEASRIAGMANEMGCNIPFPITFREFIDKRYHSKNIKGFLIDNVEYLIQSMTTVPVLGISISNTQEPFLDATSGKKQAVLCVIEDADNRVLMLDRRTEPLGYGFPGGKVDVVKINETIQDEPVVDAVNRECREETGIDLGVGVGDFIGTVLSASGGYQCHVFYKKLSALSSPPSSVKISLDEHKGYIWTNHPESLPLAGNTIEVINLWRLKR